MSSFGLLVHSKQICRGLSLQIGWGLSPITGDPRSHRGAALMWLLYSSRSLIFSGVLRTEIKVPWHANQHWLPLPPRASLSCRVNECQGWLAGADPVLLEAGFTPVWTEFSFPWQQCLRLSFKWSLTVPALLRLLLSIRKHKLWSSPGDSYPILPLAAENQALGWSDVQISYICGILRSIKQGIVSEEEMEETFTCPGKWCLLLTTNCFAAGLGVWVLP